MAEEVALDSVECENSNVAQGRGEENGAIPSKISLEVANNGDLLLARLLAQLKHDLESQTRRRSYVNEVWWGVVAKGP
jgi:hypothetical protein